MHKRERRFLQSDVTLESGESPKISGYAAVFNKKSVLLGDFVEVVDPGAFNKSLADGGEILGLFNHSNDMVLGSTASGTMRVSVDDFGLKYEIDPPDTSYARDLMVSLKRKDVRGASFGFYCIRDRWSYDKATNENVRTILEAQIFDASVCTAGAYPDASSQLRALFPDDKGIVPTEITENIRELRNTVRKEKRGRNLLAAVSTAKWAILPEKLETICAFVNAWADGHTASKEEIQAAMMGFDQDGMGSSYESSDGSDSDSPVCIIPVYGTIGQKMNMMTEFSGGCSTESLTKSFRAALADDSVTAIVFDIDSPGGTVTGVPELAAEILAARGQKPIVAVANGMAASAAYWIASAADKLVVIPSGDVGSIGVYMTHQDISAAMDKAGVKMTFIQAGKYKTEGNPYEPASASFIADAQKGVDEFYEMFIEAVAEGRGVTAEKAKTDFGQGRMLMAKDALAAGMVDAIQTLDQVVTGLTEASVNMAANQFEASVVAAAGCTCMCPQCIGGDHPNCTGPMDGECDYVDPDGDQDAPDDFNDGQQATLQESGCNCLCPECMAGDHEDCSGTEDGCDWEDFEDEDGDEDAPDDFNDGNQAALTEAELNANALAKLKAMQMATEVTD